MLSRICVNAFHKFAQILKIYPQADFMQLETKLLNCDIFILEDGRLQIKSLDYVSTSMLYSATIGYILFSR